MNRLGTAAILFVILGLNLTLIHLSESEKVETGRSIASTSLSRFDSSAQIFQGTQECSQNYSKVSNCYNTYHPPKPSISRSLIRANHDYANHGALQSQMTMEDMITDVFSKGDSTPGNYQILPNTRGSNDGRLIISGGPKLSVFRPEELNFDSRNINKTIQQKNHIPVLTFLNPNQTNMDWSNYSGWGKPNTYHYTLCDATGAGYNPAPRSCRAKYKSTHNWVYGDCYDVSIIAGSSHNENRGNGDYEKWELRSNDLTVFVPNAKTKYTKDTWIYPRINSFDLPAIYDYRTVGANSFKGLANLCNGGTPPKFCEFLDTQHYSMTGFTVDNNGNNYTDSGEYWNGEHCDSANIYGCKHKFLFELSTTDDGMLLILNLGGDSIYYSYNDKGACRADGWRYFKPLSFMPTDSKVNTKYEIAKSLKKPNGSSFNFRDSAGRDIQPGDQFRGAYPWIDREGKNLFYSAVNSARDHYLAHYQNHHYDEYPNMTYVADRDPGKFMSVIGAWTRGKAVVLDNAHNFSDFGGVQKWITKYDPTQGKDVPLSLQYQYKMHLYQGGETVLRPDAPRNFFSFENYLNYFSNLSPLLPFDVVWKMSADVQRNVDVVFDEYINKDAFIVAHMNAPMKAPDSYGRTHPHDGFVAKYPSKDVRHGKRAYFGYKESPRLQNSATVLPKFDSSYEEPPKTLRLLGGARVEPVALGGVIGKGVYLDGHNDHFDAGFKNPKSNNWYFGIWLDRRDNDDSQIRTLYFFPDGSWIGLNKNKIYTFSSKHGSNGLQTFDLSHYPFQKKRYYHLGIKVFNHNGYRYLRFYKNGTKINSANNKSYIRYNISGKSVYQQGFQLKNNYMQGGWSWFVVGDPGPKMADPDYNKFRKPFKGWLDEFRVYSLSKEETYSDRYFDEFICNSALGSLVEVDKTDEDTIFRPLLYQAYRHKLLKKERNPGPWPYDDSLHSSTFVDFKGRSIASTRRWRKKSRRVRRRLRKKLKRRFNRKPYVTSGTLEMKEQEPNPNFIPKARVCEQLAIRTHLAPADFDDQISTTLCAAYVHRNPNSSIPEDLQHKCYRKKALSVHNKPLKADESRPDFSGTPFCHSCHNQNSLTKGLKETALNKFDHIIRANDLRRQPLDHPRVIGGCKPITSPFTYEPSSTRCSTGNFQMDYLFDFNKKMEP